MSQTKSLKQLCSDPTTDIRLILSHPETLFAIKNQDPIIKTIFAPANIRVLFSHLNQEHPLEQGKKELCFRMPQAAMEIMCCESHYLTDVIFQSEREEQRNQEGKTDGEAVGAGQEKKEKKEHLLEYLLEFLTYREHYFLAGLFSKSMGSLTKRVFNPSHKYNGILCEKIFGDGKDKTSGYLFKTFNHLYSESFNELIIRWLTLKGKENDYRAEKELYLERLLALVNVSQGAELPFPVLNFGQATLESINSLIMLMLKSPLQPPPQRPQPLQHKNINLLLNKNSQKQLYETLCQPKPLQSILQPVPQPTPQKLSLIRRIIQQYRTENEQVKKMEQNYKNVRLADVVTEEMLVQGMGWVNQLLSVQGERIEYEGQGQGGEGRVIKVESKKKVNMKMVILYLEVLYEFHLLVEDLREPLTYFYEQKQKQHVSLITKLLRLKNNLVQTVLTRIMLIVLKKLNCLDFSTALLHHGIAQVIDQENIREHVLEWAKIILEGKNQQGHVYENVGQEVKWDHMGEIVKAAQEIVIGRFRFRPANLAVFYSGEKAKEYYQEFLQQPIIIEYEEKLASRKGESEQGEAEKQDILASLNLKKKMSSPAHSESVVQPSPIIKDKVIQSQEQAREKVLYLPEPQIDVLGMDSIRQGYLQYSLEDLISQIQQ